MNDNGFSYKYSAPTEEERKEIDGIRRQYAPTEEENKLEKLRRLNSIVKSSALSVALSIGIIGCLIFGLGLTMILEWNNFLCGVILGVFGTTIMLPAYPIYRGVLNHGKKKYGEEILRLSEELLNETEKNQEKYKEDIKEE